jgi:hypothetical protein
MTGRARVVAVLALVAALAIIATRLHHVEPQPLVDARIDPAHTSPATSRHDLEHRRRWRTPLRSLFASDATYTAWRAAGDARRTVMVGLWMTWAKAQSEQPILPLIFMTSSHDCPDVVRLGGDPDRLWIDGAKWVCGVARLPRHCIAYSIGSNMDVTFERDLHRAADCSSWTFDPTVPTDWSPPPDAHIVNFTRIGLGKLPGMPTAPLHSLMGMFGHTWIDVLKVDIEEAEWQWLPEFLESAESPAGEWSCDSLPLLLMIEVHFHMLGQKSGRSKLLETYLPYLQRLRALGYLHYVTEPNPFCPSCAEIAFMLDEDECRRRA